MRILNVTQTYDPFLEFGGPPVKVRALSEALVRQGHEVTVLTTDWGIEERLRYGEEKGNLSHSRFGQRREWKGVEAIYLPAWFRYRALTWNSGVGRFCEEELRNYDAVHIFGLYDFLGPRVAMRCRSARIPYVVEPIGMFVPIVRNILLKRTYHVAFGYTMLRRACYLVATSEQEMEELVGGGLAGERIVLRRNGVEGPAIVPERGSFRRVHGIASDAKLILFLGRLSQKKSPELLLQAFAKLPKSIRGNELQLVYAGPDESGMQAKLVKMARELGVGERVKLLGSLFSAAKWEAYRDADVFVLPSQNENFGNTAAESMAVGTPVVVTKECGIAPLLDGIGGLVTEHEAASITTALERMLSDPELRAKLAAGCEKVTARLGWDEPAREMELLYRKVSEKNKALRKQN